MALRKEPERRYASAEQFADDVHRYLEGLPVRAHRDSPVYRAAKFVRRHARGGRRRGSSCSWRWWRASPAPRRGLVLVRRERDRAEESSRQARQAVNQFFTRVSEERLLNQPGLHPLRKALLQDARRFYEEFLDRARRRPRAPRRAGRGPRRPPGSPGRSARRPGRPAVPAGRRALGEPGRGPARQPGVPEELARTLNELGVVLMPLEGRRDEALGIFRRAEGLLGPHRRRSRVGLATPRAGPGPPEHRDRSRLEQGQPHEAIETLGESAGDRGATGRRRPRGPRPADLHGQGPWPPGPGSDVAARWGGAGAGVLSAGRRDPRGGRPRAPELADQTYLLAMDLGD